MRALPAFLLVVLIAPACSKKKAPTAQQVDGGAGGSSATAAGPGRQPPVHRVLAPITLEEAKDFLPVLDGARVVKAAQKAAVGERVEAHSCVETGDLAAIAGALKAKLATAGWEHILVQPHPTFKERIGVNARRAGGYMLTGTVQRGQWAECVGDKGQTYISLGVHRLEQRPGGGSGPWGPGVMRVNPVVAPPAGEASGAHTANPAREAQGGEKASGGRASVNSPKPTQPPGGNP